MKSVILGVSGQDGQYLTELLLSKGHSVIGVVRRTSQPRTHLNYLVEKGLKLVEGDITDSVCMERLFREHQPDWAFDLAAMSHVGVSFTSPASTMQITGLGILNVLEAIKTVSPHTKLYHASSSEQFGCMYSITQEYDQYSVLEHFSCKNISPQKFITERNTMKRFYPHPEDFPHQSEATPWNAQSPYAVAKIAAHQYVELYREMYGLFVCSGILHNHESERRGENFVTRKITKYIGQLVSWMNENNYIWFSDYCTIGINFKFPIDGDSIESTTINTDNIITPEILKRRQESHARYLARPKLKLGNLDSCRDWSHAEDLVRAMVIMLENNKPVDYVVGSGESHSVREFVKLAFDEVGLNWEDWVELDPSLVRPAEVDYLRADYSKIKKELGWEPLYKFEDLVKRMVKHDIEQESQC